MSDVEDFAEELVDDLRIAETIAERDEKDTGERLTLDELIEEAGE